MSSTYGAFQYNESVYNAGPLPTTVLLYRANYSAFVRHDETWLVGTEHELEPLVAVGLCLIHPGLLARVDGVPMPGMPLKSRPEYAAAISAAHRMVVHALRAYGHAVREPTSYAIENDSNLTRVPRSPRDTAG